jgi:hypothetical protein
MPRAGRCASQKPYYFEMLDPTSWRDSILAPIFKLLDGLRKAVNDRTRYGAGVSHYAKKRKLVRGCSKAVADVLRGAVATFEVS